MVIVMMMTMEMTKIMMIEQAGEQRKKICINALSHPMLSLSILMMTTHDIHINSDDIWLFTGPNTKSKTIQKHTNIPPAELLSRPDPSPLFHLPLLSKESIPAGNDYRWLVKIWALYIRLILQRDKTIGIDGKDSTQSKDQRCPVNVWKPETHQSNSADGKRKQSPTPPQHYSPSFSPFSPQLFLRKNLNRLNITFSFLLVSPNRPCPIVQHHCLNPITKQTNHNF